MVRGRGETNLGQGTNLILRERTGHRASIPPASIGSTLSAYRGVASGPGRGQSEESASTGRVVESTLAASQAQKAGKELLNMSSLVRSLLSKKLPATHEPIEPSPQLLITMSQQTETVLITGAGGWLGSLLPETLIATSAQTTFKFILVDVREPKCKVDLSSSSLPHKVITIGADLAAPGEVTKLFQTELGVPDTIYSLHGIMSLGSELDFDLGIRVNFDSTRQLLDAARSYSPAAGGDKARKQPITFVFTSSVATYGGPIPDVVLPSTACTPEGAYGTAKLMVEYLVTEYSRRGFVGKFAT